jgi:hypothetical protein
MEKSAIIPDGYYINWYGSSAIIYDGKRWPLACFVKLCGALNIPLIKMCDWLNENRKELKISDTLWDDIQNLPFVTPENIHSFL